MNRYEDSFGGVRDRSTGLLISCRNLCNRYMQIILANVKLTSKRNGGSPSRKANGRRGRQAKLVVSEKSDEGSPVGPSAAVEAEKKLWIDLKKFKDTGDRNVISYINGFYVCLLQEIQVSWHPSRGKLSCDLKSAVSPMMTQASELNDRKDHNLQNDKCQVPALTPEESSDLRDVRSLVYNVLIRLGDVNRYLKSPVVAKCYYTQAREMNPFKGHAFNQLALISGNDCMLQIYYYVRACNSLEDPVSIAEENLKSQVAKYSKENSSIAALFDKENNRTLNPQDIKNWIFVVIISIYSKNLKLVVQTLLDQTIGWLNKQLGLDPFSSSLFVSKLETDSVCLLPAVDVLLDYIIVYSKHERDLNFLMDHENQMRNLKMLVTSLLSQSDNFAICCTSTALKHDYVLVGFKPLEEAHQKLVFESQGYSGSVKNNEFIFLIKKISDKTDSVLQIITDFRKQHASTSTLQKMSGGIRDAHLNTGNKQHNNDQQKSKSGVRSSRNSALVSIFSGNDR